jgi:hypothetical protein
MSSYTASARIDTARLHLRFVDAGPDGVGLPLPHWSGASGGTAETEPLPAVVPAIEPIEDDTSTWWDRVSIEWRQLTWYLFNPEGWR